MSITRNLRVFYHLAMYMNLTMKVRITESVFLFDAACSLQVSDTSLFLAFVN